MRLGESHMHITRIGGRSRMVVIQFRMITTVNMQLTQILRFKALTQEISLSRSTIYKKIKEGTFPSPISLGARATGFLRSDVDAWIESCVASSRPTAGAQ
jgi:prophage regulatory protein